MMGIVVNTTDWKGRVPTHEGRGRTQDGRGWGLRRLQAVTPPKGTAERKTIRRIRAAVRSGDLEEPFSPQQVNAVLGIGWAGTFLPKHRVGNPGGYTELFERFSGRPALYRLSTK